MIIKVQKTNSFSLYNNLYCKFKVNYNKINNFQKILLFNFVIFNQVFKIRFFFDYNISFAYFKRLFNTFLFLYSFDFVNYFFYSLLKNRCHNVSINKNYILVCNYINNLLYLKLFISYQWITFYILFSLFTFKKKVSLLTFNKRTPVLFVMFKKVQLKMDLSWHTFLLLINKLFSIWKLKILLYERSLKRITNCYIVLKQHNLFITLSSFTNVPLMIYSAGRAGFGQRTKQKKSTQAAARIALLVCQQLKKKRYSTRLSIILCTNKLFDKRIKSILSTFKIQRLTIHSFVPRIIRDVGGVRPKKVRRV